MYTLQTMTVNNVTFSGNTAAEAGGALETVCRSVLCSSDCAAR